MNYIYLYQSRVAVNERNKIPAEADSLLFLAEEGCEDKMLLDLSMSSDNFSIRNVDPALCIRASSYRRRFVVFEALLYTAPVAVLIIDSLPVASSLCCRIVCCRCTRHRTPKSAKVDAVDAITFTIIISGEFSFKCKSHNHT